MVHERSSPILQFPIRESSASFASIPPPSSIRNSDETRTSSTALLPQAVSNALAERHANTALHDGNKRGRESSHNGRTSSEGGHGDAADDAADGDDGDGDGDGDTHSNASPSHSSISTLGSDSFNPGDAECPTTEWEAFNYNRLSSTPTDKLQKSRSGLSTVESSGASTRISASSHNPPSKTLTCFVEPTPHDPRPELDEPTSPVSVGSMLASALWPDSSPEPPSNPDDLALSDGDDCDASDTKDTLVSVGGYYDSGGGGGGGRSVSAGRGSKSDTSGNDGGGGGSVGGHKRSFKTRRKSSPGSTARSPAVGFAIVGVGMSVLTVDTLMIRLASEENTNNWAISFYRYLFYAIATTMYITYTKKGVRKTARAFVDVGRIGIAASVLFSVCNICFSTSVLYTDAANTLVIVASSPLWAALLSRIILKEKIAIWTAVATVFAFGAVVMVFLTEILDNGSVDADVSNAATTATAPPMTTTTPTSTTANASLAGDASGNLVAATKSTPQQHAVGMLLALVVALAMAGYLCCVRYAALHYPERDMVPTSAIAGVLSAIAGAVGMVATGGTALVTGAPMGWLALQGLVVLPVAFICMTLGQCLSLYCVRA